VSGEVAELADKVALDKELGDGVRPAAGEGGEEPDEQPATTATANASTAARILVRPIMSAVSSASMKRAYARKADGSS
jgi:hypothetical protein